jgi:mRNA-degrading endonuclease RelE of RelBE toxin-antitoxin system
MSEWDWELTDTARRDFDSLDEYARDRITSKLDEIATDQWREPPEYLEPLEGAPHDKLRIGPFRLGCRADRSADVLYVLRVRKRGGDAYRSDDDD